MMHTRGIDIMAAKLMTKKLTVEKEADISSCIKQFVDENWKDHTVYFPVLSITDETCEEKK